MNKETMSEVMSELGRRSVEKRKLDPEKWQKHLAKMAKAAQKHFKNNKGKVIGYLSEDGVYRARKKGSKHTFRLFDAWGLDKAVFDKIRGQGCTELRFLDEETDEVFSISIEDFEANSVTRDFDGKQMFVSKKFWNKKML